MRTMHRILMGFSLPAAVTSACLLLLSASAHALPSTKMDFGLVAPTMTGQISYNGMGGPLVGTNLQIDEVAGLDVNDLLGDGGGPFDCIGCVLNFTTGNLNATSAPADLVKFWSFGGGVTTSITITGGVDADGSGSIEAGEPSGVLMSGNFGTATVLVQGTTLKIAGSTFSDQKNDDLEVLLGFSPGLIPAWEGGFNISFNAPGVPPSGFTSTGVLSGDVINSPVPEPGTLLLLGSGLVGFGFLARRRRRHS